MSPVSSNEAKLKRVLHGIRLGLAAQACKADPVVDALGAVFVADVKHDGFFFPLEEQPRSAFSQLRRLMSIRKSTH